MAKLLQQLDKRADRMRIICLFSMIFMLFGCSPINTEPAKESVDMFHKSFQKCKYSDIYRMTSPSFRKITSESEFIDIMKEAKKTNLGEYKKSTLKVEKSTYRFLSNNEISLIYYSAYSKNVAQETFTFESVKDKVELAGYRYDTIN